MRATNDDFQAEVFRRSKLYKQKQATRRKQLTAGMLSLVLVVGGFGIWRMTAPDRAEHMILQGTTGAKQANDTEPEEHVEKAEEYSQTGAAGAMKGDTDNTLGMSFSDGMTDGFFGNVETLTLEAEYSVYFTDTEEIVVTVTNPNTEAVMLLDDDFYIEFIGTDGSREANMKQPSDESSAEVKAVRVFGGEQAQFTLTLADYGLHTPLSAGEYAVQLAGYNCEPARFTVEVS